MNCLKKKRKTSLKVKLEMKRKLMTKIYLTKFYFLIVNLMKLVFRKNRHFIEPAGRSSN